MAYLDDTFDGLADIRSVADELRRLGLGFKLTGNDLIADELLFYRTKLLDSCDKIRKATGENVTEQYKATQSVTGVILTAMLDNI